jgi:hypothetical protein
MRKKIAIVGATSNIAHECAKIWASEASFDFVLIGRRRNDLETVKNDLSVRDPDAEIMIFESCLTDQTQISLIIRSLSTIDIMFVAMGMLSKQEALQRDLSAIKSSFIVNAVAPIIWIEEFLNTISERQNGHHSKIIKIAVIGSVAGDRGRKSNYLYGTAKGCLEIFVEGLQHRLHSTNIIPILIKPGPTRTKMTEDLGLTRLASVEGVAKEIVEGITTNKTIIYTPKKWQIIMFIIKRLPSFIFNKLDV